MPSVVEHCRQIRIQQRVGNATQAIIGTGARSRGHQRASGDHLLQDRWAFLLAAITLVIFTSALLGAQQSTTEPRTALSGQVELGRLIDLCAERLGLRIEYDATALKGTVTIRLGTSVSDQELWLLTNQVLASRGFTTVNAAKGVISVVKIAEAPGMAGLQFDEPSPDQAGVVSVALRVRHQSPKTIIDAVKLLLSK